MKLNIITAIPHLGDTLSRYVISLGGSLLNPREGLVEYLENFREFILSELEEERQFFIVTGGGELARRYMNLSRKEGVSQYHLDLIGIEATRLNALMVSSYFGELSNSQPFRTVEEAALYGELYPVVVGGGTVPGHSTDAVSALVAERVGAELFINLTAVGGVYDKDPRQYKDARLIEKMSSEELLRMTVSGGFSAGTHKVIDPLAAVILHRSGLKCVVADGTDLGNLRSILRGERFKGTLISPSGGI